MPVHPFSQYALPSPVHPLSFRLDSILPHREVHLLFLLLLGHHAGLLLRQPPPNRPRLFRSQIQRQVLLLLIEKPELRSLVRVDDCQDLGNRFPKVVTVEQTSWVNNVLANSRERPGGVLFANKKHVSGN